MRSGACRSFHALQVGYPQKTRCEFLLCVGRRREKDPTIAEAPADIARGWQCHCQSFGKVFRDNLEIAFSIVHQPCKILEQILIFVIIISKTERWACSSAVRAGDS
jgi:hypothetical protein